MMTIMMTSSKSIWYFQFFVITYRLKIKPSLSLWSGATKFLTPIYTFAVRVIATSLHLQFRVLYYNGHDDIIEDENDHAPLCIEKCSTRSKPKYS